MDVLPAEIILQLRNLGLRPTKAKGQNFLIGKNILGQIIMAANLKPDDQVLEIGPGLGILTAELIKNCAKVVAIELDKNLQVFLKDKFKANRNLEIISDDVLNVRNEDIAEKFSPTKKYKLVANLPYAISKPVIRKFLTFSAKPTELVVLLQKEVAEKICFKKDHANILGLSVWFYGQPEIVGYVPATSFYPQPKVESAIVKIVVRQDLPVEVRAIFAEKNNSFVEKDFWRLIKFGFSSPRKQLHNNLAAGLKITSAQVKEVLKKYHLREDSRAQNLSLKNWASLYQHFLGQD